MKKVMIDLRDHNFGMFDEEKTKVLKNVFEVENYTHLGYKMMSIINTCKTALMYRCENNDDASASLIEIVDVLDIAGKLFPYDEFSLLTDLKKKYDETDN